LRYRKIDANQDRVFGHGQADFWRDVPDGPAQSVVTRLHMQLGEWFLDITDGTPYQTRVLGKYTGSTRDPTLRSRILGTTGVTGIAAYSSNLDRNTRAFTVEATVDTEFGQAVISESM
jgi:hypothetical protein